jgi:hypothetical protein
MAAPLGLQAARRWGWLGVMCVVGKEGLLFLKKKKQKDFCL